MGADQFLPRFTRRGALAAISAGIGVAVLNACTGKPGSGSPAESGATGTHPTSAKPTPALVVTSAHGPDAVLPGDTLTITVAHGSATKVTATHPDGTSYSGKLNGSTWTCDRNLWPATTYTISVAVEDDQHKASTLTQTITTAAVDTIIYQPAYVLPNVGVGMPVYVQFDDTIDQKAHRAAIEKAAIVTTSPVQEGSWGWVDNKILMWRPKTYWQPGTTVSVSLPFGGIQVGSTQYLADDTNYSISIAGNSNVLRVDLGTQYMHVYQDDVLLRDCPVSTGGVGHETYDGTKVIMQKFEMFTMDSSTYGVPATSAEGYKIDVPNCQRITWSGEFLHSADWSLAQQGVVASSHGCTNLSPADAAWLMTVTNIGDPVEYTGVTAGGAQLSLRPDDGIGCWVYSWADWQKQSALS